MQVKFRRFLYGTVHDGLRQEDMFKKLNVGTVLSWAHIEPKSAIVVLSLLYIISISRHFDHLRKREDVHGGQEQSIPVWGVRSVQQLAVAAPPLPLRALEMKLHFLSKP